MEVQGGSNADLDRSVFETAVADLNPAGRYLLEASILRGLSDEDLATALQTSASDVRERREAALSRLGRKSRATLRQLPRRAAVPRMADLGSPRSKLLWGAAAAVIACLVGLLVNLHAALACAAVAALLATVLVGVRPALAVSVLPLLIFFEATLPSILSALVLLIALALLSFGRARLRVSAPLGWAAAFAVWAFASAIWTVDLSASGAQFAGLAFSLALAVAIATLINSDADLRIFVYAYLLVSVATGIEAIAAVAIGATSRAEGFVGDPNIFAVYQLVALPLAFLLAADTSRPWVRRCAYLAMLVSVTATFASLSRGGLIALGIVAVLLLFAPVSGLYRSSRQKAAVWSFVLVATVVGLLVFSGGLSNRISDNEVAAGSGRVNEWRAGVSALESHPVVGLGLGGFYVDSNELLRSTPGVELKKFRLAEAGHRVHNAYIESAAELGVVGLLLFLGVLISTVLALQRVSRSLRGANRFRSSMASALIISLSGFAVASIFLSTAESFILFGLVGLAVALAEPQEVPEGAG